MKVLLLGGSGMLGSSLRATCPGEVSLSAPGHAALDVMADDDLARALDAERPDWVINCVAYTAVDAAESDEPRAWSLNAFLPEVLGGLAAMRGVRVLHVSTDYVFGAAASGSNVGTRPWREDDPCAPVSVYGRTKLLGERELIASGAEHVIVRTAWLFGDPGRNFPRTMWERAQLGLPSRVVDDQRGAPTSALDLAGWCWALLRADARGIVHASNAGEASWADVAEYVYAAAGRAGMVTRVSSDEYETPAPRPRYSVLDGSRLESLIAAARRPWQLALDDYLVTLKQRSAA